MFTLYTLFPGSAEKNVAFLLHIYLSNGAKYFQFSCVGKLLNKGYIKLWPMRNIVNEVHYKFV